MADKVITALEILCIAASVALLLAGVITGEAQRTVEAVFFLMLAAIVGRGDL